MRRAEIPAILFVTVAALTFASTGHAQSVSTFQSLAQASPTGASLSSLPPSLRAAVLSGNANQVTQAIAVLSGGNAQRQAALANSVVQVAETLLNTNPQAAIQAAGAAVNTVRQTTVQTSSPQQTESVLVSAARIFVSPSATTANPQGAADLASSTLAAAVSTGSGALTATIAAQSMQTAERVLDTNPAAAVQITAQAVQSVQSSATAQSSAPATVMTVLTSATRVVSNPAIQRGYGATVANVSVQVSQIVSNPVVYQASPQSAIQVMAGAYSAAGASGSSSAQQSVTQNLVQAQSSSTLNQVNQSNSSQISAILGGQTTPTVVTNTNSNTNTTSNVPVVVVPTEFSSASPS